MSGYECAFCTATKATRQQPCAPAGASGKPEVRRPIAAQNEKLALAGALAEIATCADFETPPDVARIV